MMTAGIVVLVWYDGALCKIEHASYRFQLFEPEVHQRHLYVHHRFNAWQTEGGHI